MRYLFGIALAGIVVLLVAQCSVAQAEEDPRYVQCATDIHNEFFRRESIYSYDWEPAGITKKYISIDVRGLNAYGVKVTQRFRCPI